MEDKVVRSLQKIKNKYGDDIFIDIRRFGSIIRDELAATGHVQAQTNTLRFSLRREKRKIRKTRIYR